MKNIIFTVALLSATTLTANAGYLCSYTAYINNNNKFNSSGSSIVNGVNRTSAAAILRQNRADVYRFGVGTFGDTGDCYFSNINNRARIPAMLNRGSISSNTIRQIVSGNPLIQVDVFTDHIDVRPY